MFSKLKSLISLAYRGDKRMLSSFTKFSEQKIHLPDAKLDVNYVRSGDGAKAVLLMPGACGSAWTDFRPQIEKLPDLLPNHSIIAWDPPGYGRSIPPKRQFSADFFRKDADFASSLMRALSFDKYSVLGWSDGGITAMILAAKNSQSVDRLVIWGCNAYILPEELEIVESMFHSFFGLFQKAAFMISRCRHRYSGCVQMVTENASADGATIWCREFRQAVVRLGGRLWRRIQSQ